MAYFIICTDNSILSWVTSTAKQVRSTHGPGGRDLFNLSEAKVSPKT